MRWLKNPMANAVYVALITAIYAAIFIVSSEFVMSYENLLSDSGWASFIISQNMKFVGIGMIGVAIIVDTLSALRRKRYDEYQIVLLEKVFLFNGLFTAVLFPLSLVVLILAPMYFVETIFALILFQWGVMAITELCYQTSIKIRSVLDMKRSMGQFIGAFAPLWVSERPGGLSQAGYQSRNRPHRAGLFSVVCVRGYEQKCDCPEIDCVRDSKPDSLQAANGDELP